MAIPLIDSNGHSVTLGKEIGRGGEGAVYDIKEQPDLVAKIYLTAPSRTQAEKITAMAALASDDVSRLAAWPRATILSRGNIVGFLMPKISGFRPAFELYGPKLRLQKFPQADWRFLIRAAANTARAVAAVHGAGHVIGDINHGNIVVGQNATVCLIDCDSFQITSSHRTWFCEVGVPTHQPPELQGISFSGLTRTRNHDAFGLAIIIFQMLCLARHPFSGRWLGRGDQPPIEDAIKRFRYAYSANQSETMMAPPRGSLPIAALGKSITNLFDRAFSRAGSWQDNRPAASEWIAALTSLEDSLRQCNTNPSHHFRRDLKDCPWCSIESQSGVRLFPVTFVCGTSGSDGFLVLWRQAEAICPPAKMPQPTKPSKVKPTAAARKAGKIKRASVILSLIYTIVAMIAATGLEGSPVAILLSCSALIVVAGTVQALRRLGREAVQDFDRAQKRWKNLSLKAADNALVDRAETIKKQMLETKSEYDRATAEQAKKLKALVDNQFATQLNRYLDRFRIDDAGIQGIGPSKVLRLQIYSVETAADISEHKILQISGFGSRTVQKLLDWRKSKELSFRFNPQEPISPADLAAVENAFGQRRRDLELRLKSQITDLRTAVAGAIQHNDDLARELLDLEPVYAQAAADRRAVALIL